jgi:tetratricopeptide (TPR) repeat protein/O-antigen ligase
MRPPGPRQLNRILPFALYAIFLWRTPYSLKSLPLRILDWVVPVAVLGTWAVLRWRRRAPWPRTAVDRPLLALALVMAVTTPFSVNLRASLRGTWQLWLGILILWAMVDAVRRGRAGVLWRALYLMAGVVCIISGVEFLAWYFGWPLLSSFQQGWPAIGGLADPFPPALHRLGLALTNITALSAFVALLIPPAIAILASTRHRDVRLGMGLWLVAAGAVELLALSRGGFLALGVSVPLLLLGSTGAPRFRRRWRAIQWKRWRPFLAVAAVLALVAAVGAGLWLASRLSAHGTGDAVRWDLWRSALAIFGDHPLVGVGRGAYGTALRLYREPLLARDHVLTAHNLYLNTGAETGVFGLLAGAWLLLALAWAWWRRWRAEAPGTPSWWRVLGLGAALAGLAAQSMVDTFVEPAIVLPATFFAAIILARRPSKATTGNQPRRWPWIAAVAVLLLGAVGFGWDDWGYAQFARSITWTQQGDVDKALSLAESAREHDAGLGLYACHAGYLYGEEGTMGPALARYEECLAKTTAPGWVERLNLATLLWQDGQQIHALATVTQATAQTPLEWMPWLNRGLWAEAMGRTGEATEAYAWVLALDPELAGSPFWQGGERAGLWDEIVGAGQEAAARLEEGRPAWRWQVLVAAGENDAAAAGLTAWLNAHPDDAEAMAWLGEALLGLGQPDVALEWLDRALAREPSQGRSYLARGQAHLALGRYDEAEQDLRTSLFLEPTEQVHLELARLARQRGDEQAALREYARALRPLELMQGYNVVLYGRSGWPVPLSQAARIGYRQDGEAALEWGALLEEQGDPTGAREVYAAALALDSYLDSVRQRLEGRLQEE